MTARYKEILTRLGGLDARLTRVESRIVQVMNHLGIKPKGVIPDELRKQQKERERK
jgi:hypothetical protein